MSPEESAPLSSLCRTPRTGGSEGNTCRSCDGYGSVQGLQPRARVEKRWSSSRGLCPDAERLRARLRKTGAAVTRARESEISWVRVLYFGGKMFNFR